MYTEKRRKMLVFIVAWTIFSIIDVMLMGALAYALAMQYIPGAHPRLVAAATAGVMQGILQWAGQQIMKRFDPWR